MGLPRNELDDILRQTLDDRRLSRTERRALTEVFADLDLSDDDRAFIRHRVFALAREQLRDTQAAQTLDWAEEVVKILHGKLEADPTISEVHFSPGDQCLRTIVRLLKRSKKNIDICVFTITDNRLAEEILAAHRRGVTVRILSDNDKAHDRGSDIERLAEAGVEVCVDESEHHMHHKFAVFDFTHVLTGSYNWTRSAAMHNRENVLVSDDPKLVRQYQVAFDELWAVLVKENRLTR
jgi:phosphatidylserine/phosphatidylglycerophosphate/cardiolipin synthase-like enzyme